MRDDYVFERKDNMKTKKFLAVTLAVVMSVALCACGGDKNGNNPGEGDNTLSEATPIPGGSIVFGMTQDLVSLDPHVNTDAGTRDVVFNLYEGLVKPASNGDIVPAVASDVEILDDAKKYTFTLRDGITFHDGSAVTVEDVKYSIERYAEIQGESSAFSGLVDEIIIEDEKTVVVTLNESYSEFLAMMTLAIIPAANEDVTGNPIGTGPFKYVSYEAGQKIVMEKYEGYWKADEVSLDQVTFKFIADVDTAYIELQGGSIDVMKYLTAAQADALGDEFTIYEGSMNMVQGMFLNSDYEPLNNIKVRQAICYAVDRQAANQFLFGGKSHLIGSHLPPSLSKYYAEEAESVYTYDPQKAKELLKEAGYGDGFDLVITVASSYSQHVDTAQIFVEQLRAVGINATIEQVEWSAWLEDVYKGGDFQATVIAFDGTLAPGEMLMRYVSDSSKNFMHYNNPAYDEAYYNAYNAIDDETKIQYYKEAQMILAEDAASVYIQDPANLVAVSKDFAGYTFYPVSAEDLSLMYQVEWK